jgi:hypothetical protein
VSVATAIADPFTWDRDDEDRMRVTCRCGHLGAWLHSRLALTRDEDAHHCLRAEQWRATL